MLEGFFPCLLNPVRPSVHGEHYEFQLMMIAILAAAPGSVPAPADEPSPVRIDVRNINSTLVVMTIQQIAYAVQRLIQPFVQGQAEVCTSVDAWGRPSAECSAVAAACLEAGIEEVMEVMRHELFDA